MDEWKKGLAYLLDCSHVSSDIDVQSGPGTLCCVTPQLNRDVLVIMVLSGEEGRKRR